MLASNGRSGYGAGGRQRQPPGILLGIFRTDYPESREAFARHPGGPGKQAEQSKQPERERKERMSHLPSSSPLPGGEWQAREGVGTALFLCARIQQAGC